MSGNRWHNTEDELKYIRSQIGRAAGLLQPTGPYTRAQLLEGYIRASLGRSWGHLDKFAIMNAAEHELRKEQAKES